jgi:hypothetical protein
MLTSDTEMLAHLLRQQRVIPFLGAGFSAPLGLPEWDDLLRQVVADIPNAPSYEEVRKCCQGDPLQIAEYCYLKFDRTIGPLRHRLSALVQTRVSPTSSTAHVELVNLNAPQIYTTNYDEGIEQVFRALGVPFACVATPKDIANADRSKPQVVKYHGDLRYENTLVLTESSYYSRLEFESPLDLKFRSDLLGRSVLFVGYSFRDINIRIIWFKLMEMMRGVPEGDRPSSYIVRFEKNEVLQELYDAVGIKTIYLDPDGKATTREGRTLLLDRFMMGLSLRVSEDAQMPGGDVMFTSPGLVKDIRTGVERRSRTPRSPTRDPLLLLLRHAAARRVPRELESDVNDCLHSIAKSSYAAEGASWALRAMSKPGIHVGAALCIMSAITRSQGREAVLDDPAVDWAALWSIKIPDSDAEYLIKVLRQEIEYHNNFGGDEDIAYAADIVKRIESAFIVEESALEIRASAADALRDAAKVLSSIAELRPQSTGPPDVELMLREIRSRTDDPDVDIDSED